MLRIGLTGGIGSGKSIVARCFAELGVPIIDTDRISRALTETGEPGYHAVVELFGRRVLDQYGRIDRRRLREHVFANTAARKQLEDTLHPLIRKETERQIASLDAPYCIVVVPLLFEAGFNDLVDRVLVVDTTESEQIRRVAERDGLAPEKVQEIIAAQLPRSVRRRRADDLISNDSTLAALQAAVQTLHQRYLASSQRPA